MSAPKPEKRGPWVAIALCAALAVIAVVLSVYSDSGWKIPLLIVVPACCMVAVTVILQIREENRELRRQLSKLEQKLADAAPSPAGESPKGAYSQDDDGGRRLHISRLQTFLLFALPSALMLV